MDSVDSVYAATAQYMTENVVHPLVMKTPVPGFGMYYTSAQYETGIWGSYSAADQDADPSKRNLYTNYDKWIGQYVSLRFVPPMLLFSAIMSMYVCMGIFVAAY